MKSIIDKHYIVDVFDLVIGYDETERKPNMDITFINENGNLVEGDTIIFTKQDVFDKVNPKSIDVVKNDNGEYVLQINY